MITQELIDYVKTQLSVGVTREQITSDLLGQGGWTMEQINEVFASTSGVPVSSNSDMSSELVENKYWSKWIPVTNKIFMTAVLVMLFVVDLFILVTDSMGLGLETMLFFYGIMFIPFLLFLRFYFSENRKLNEKFKYSESKLDVWFFVLVLVRNVVIVLNLIPFVQIIGAMALAFGIVPYLIAYYFMQRSRMKLVVSV